MRIGLGVFLGLALYGFADTLVRGAILPLFDVARGKSTTEYLQVSIGEWTIRIGAIIASAGVLLLAIAAVVIVRSRRRAVTRPTSPE